MSLSARNPSAAVFPFIGTGDEKSLSDVRSHRSAPCSLLLQDARFFQARLDQFNSLLSIGLVKRITLSRLVDDSGSAYSYLKPVERLARITLSVPERKGPVPFSHLVRDFFAKEILQAPTKLDKKELSDLRLAYPHLKPPVQPSEHGAQEYKITALPRFLYLNPLVVTWMPSGTKDKDGKALGSLVRQLRNVKVEVSLDLGQFIAEECVGAASSTYDLQDVIVHRGSASSGHYFIYTHVSGDDWYAPRPSSLFSIFWFLTRRCLDDSTVSPVSFSTMKDAAEGRHPNTNGCTHRFLADVVIVMVRFVRFRPASCQRIGKVFISRIILNLECLFPAPQSDLLRARASRHDFNDLPSVPNVLLCLLCSVLIFRC